MLAKCFHKKKRRHVDALHFFILYYSSSLGTEIARFSVRNRACFGLRNPVATLGKKMLQSLVRISSDFWLTNARTQKSISHGKWVIISKAITRYLVKHSCMPAPQPHLLIHLLSLCFHPWNSHFLCLRWNLRAMKRKPHRLSHHQTKC